MLVEKGRKILQRYTELTGCSRTFVGCSLRPTPVAGQRTVGLDPNGLLADNAMRPLSMPILLSRIASANLERRNLKAICLGFCFLQHPPTLNA